MSTESQSINTNAHSDNSGVTFVLKSMDLDISLNQGIVIDSIIDAKSLESHAIAQLDISYADISGVFQYMTDAIDVSGSALNSDICGNTSTGIATPEVSDWSFNHISTNWFSYTGGGTPGTRKQLIKISNAIVEDNTKIGPYSSPPINKDSVRHMAQEVFGSYTAVDIFQNENALVADVSNNDASFNTLIKAKLDDAAALDEGSHADFGGTGNFARELLTQLLNSAFGNPKRVAADLSRNHYSRVLVAAAGTDNSFNSGVLDIPFLENDIIAIKVNYDYPSTTSIVSGSSVSSRSYIIKLKITGATPWSNGGALEILNGSGQFLL
tara:strand:- start:80 stop:1054 length:975 start_codon:yes stop_codon:yes gene_type:complete